MAELDDATLDELARLASEATPGPWTVTGCTRGADWVCSGRGCLTNTEDGTFRPANAEYIAAANPATVAALVAEVARLRAALAPFAAVHCANFMDDEGGSCPANDVVPEHWCEYCNARAALGGAE